MIGEIIAIGDELTSGSVLNTTSAFAASHLFAAGHEILAMTTIGDEPELIGRTLQRALQRADFVIVTGGLGPTTDDLTNAAVSSALARPATFYPEILKKIQAHGKNLPSGQQISLEKLAWLPAGAHALHWLFDQAGYLGSNMMFPFTRRRSPGRKWTHSGESSVNAGIVWFCGLVVFWNLYSRSGLPVPPFGLVKLMAWVFFVPVGIYAFLRRFMRHESP